MQLIDNFIRRIHRQVQVLLFLLFKLSYVARQPRDKLLLGVIKNLILLKLTEEKECLFKLLSLLFHAVDLWLHQSLLLFEKPLEFVYLQGDLSVERERGFALLN